LLQVHVEARNYEHLLNYLNSNQLSTNFIIHTDENIVESIANNHDPIDNNYVTQKIYPILGEGGGGTAGGGTPPPSNPNNQDPLDGLDQFLAGEEECESFNAFLGSIFGKQKSCTDRYGGRRVRTDVYNFKFFINIPHVIEIDIYTAGIKVRNQRRKLGFIWFNSEADLVASGVEKFQLKYDYSSLLYPSQYINNINPQFVKYSYKPSNISYSVNTNFWDPNNSTYSPISSINYPSYPDFIRKGFTIETVGNSTIDYLINAGNDALAADKLNEYFWDFAYSTAKSQMQSLAGSTNFQTPDQTSLIANYPNQGIALVHQTYYSYCTNCKKRNKTFALGGSAGFTIGYNGTDGTFYYDTNASGTTTIAPQDMRVRMYGVVKEGGTWHGNIMSYNFD